MTQSHAFEVGGRYRNNLGEYEVLAVDGQRLTVRFDDGRVQELDVATQSRIWHRHEEERARAALPPVSKATTRRKRSTPKPRPPKR